MLSSLSTQGLGLPVKNRKNVSSLRINGTTSSINSGKAIIDTNNNPTFSDKYSIRFISGYNVPVEFFITSDVNGEKFGTRRQTGVGFNSQVEANIFVLGSHTSTYSFTSGTRILLRNANDGTSQQLMFTSSGPAIERNVADTLQINSGTLGALRDLTCRALLPVAQAATDIPLVVKGAASQSANLTDWRDSSDNVLLALSKQGSYGIKFTTKEENNSGITGTFYFGTGRVWNFTDIVGAATGFNVGTGTGEVIRLNTITTGAGISFACGGLNNNFNLCSNGTIGINTSTTAPNATLQVKGRDATKVGLSVTGFTSQSANLQEWQNNSNVVLASVSSVGKIFSFNSDGTKSVSIEHDGTNAKITSTTGEVLVTPEAAYGLRISSNRIALSTGGSDGSNVFTIYSNSYALLAQVSAQGALRLGSFNDGSKTATLAPITGGVGFEINNGTPGDLRDLSARNLYSNGNPVGTGREIYNLVW